MNTRATGESGTYKDPDLNWENRPPEDLPSGRVFGDPNFLTENIIFNTNLSKNDFGRRRKFNAV